jgi:hypothetical protein
MELTAALTIYAMFSCFLLFPRMGLPAALHRTAMALLVAELVALGMWSYGTPGSTSAELGRVAAGLDIPLLALALVLVAFGFGVAPYFRRHEDPGDGLAREGRVGDGDDAGRGGPSSDGSRPRPGGVRALERPGVQAGRSHERRRRVRRRARP